MWWHPLNGIPTATLVWILAWLVVMSLVVFARLESLGRRLRNRHSPLGIVSLTTARSAAETRQILDAWQPDGRLVARQQLHWDYGFIPLYTTTLAILGLFAARWFHDKGWDGVSQVTLALSWLQWLAGLVDFAENITVLRILHAYPTVPESLTLFAGWFTRIKFLFILLSLGVGAFAVVTWMA